MKKPESVVNLTELGRVRLSDNFFMRDMLYSEVANHHGMPNVPDFPDIAIETGSRLCQELLEPLQKTFGKISIRSAYRSPSVNAFCNEKQKNGKSGYSCASNAANYAHHIWDYADTNGRKGALATVVVNRYIDYFDRTQDWQSLAWWIHDHLPYGSLYFYPKLCAFNIGWHENPARRIDSYVAPKGCLTKPGMDNHGGDHSNHYNEAIKRLNT